MTRLNNLRVLQNKAIRIISGTDIYSHSRSALLYYQNNCLNIFDIHNLQTGIFVQNWINDRLPSIFDTLFNFRCEIHSHQTRSASNLSCPLFRLNSSQHSISFSGPKFWNGLPNDLKQPSSSNYFKFKLKKFMISKYY